MIDEKKPSNDSDSWETPNFSGRKELTNDDLPTVEFFLKKARYHLWRSYDLMEREPPSDSHEPGNSGEAW